MSKYTHGGLLEGERLVVIYRYPDGALQVRHYNQHDFPLCTYKAYKCGKGIYRLYEEKHGGTSNVEVRFDHVEFDERAFEVKLL